eukprot:1164300-Pyramimonas_sp.AAC.1
MAPKVLLDAPRPPQDGPEKPNGFPRRPPTGKNHSNTEGKPMIVAFSPFRFQWPSEAQDGSKMAQ